MLLKGGGLFGLPDGSLPDGPQKLSEEEAKVVALDTRYRMLLSVGRP